MKCATILPENRFTKTIRTGYIDDSLCNTASLCLEDGLIAAPVLLNLPSNSGPALQIRKISLFLLPLSDCCCISLLDILQQFGIVLSLLHIPLTFLNLSLHSYWC